MKKMIEHIHKWNCWRKKSLNSPIIKILVLFKIAKSPTMNAMLSPKEAEDIYNAFLENFEIDH